ncbi:flavodoxin-dependent (E)-4-hydroxy-3-methylbut-2-enyl-diphosphate synthase [candidate division WOR-3 bacterium]|uniref:4-hydroxy-3-methylbut-2-en-1-yl diphosphate synthase (flavodoxin) n=1 Tax=candidate division WOR-3 bacterium TaxID=2052148 RepID=A0A9D5KAG1_UNCW3|nr:flavodoxin-dependent (E)-4-hydroxy-3-methylbut-2-enyl-diphosphate synthase [candidate division WOR-3 bacterium]MBD3365288.1 flavodoxin-dependent (E)-4-hydroxy-3-methylbut-2-enyl-diphosphate synthase [candidate division WOR-3 bacterium]
MERLSVDVGGVKIGGGAPVVVQTMTKSRSRNTPQIIKEILSVVEVGAELVRVAIPEEADLESFAEIVKASPVPVIADVHFNPRLALGAIKNGAAKLRINPGNIGSADDLKEIALRAKGMGIPIRVGVNAGSLPPYILERFTHPTTEAILAALSDYVRIFEDFGFTDLVISAKTSDARQTIDIYRGLYKRFPYPLHLGVTEAGLPFEGAIRSTAAMAPLLLEGIGDTIRISLAGEAVREIEACRELLSSLGLRKHGPKLIVCPTCGRTEIDVVELAEKVKEKLKGIKQPMTVAVMGCVVNGPGEAMEADYGIAGGKGKGALFRKGEVIATVEEDKLLDALLDLISKDINP